MNIFNTPTQLFDHIIVLNQQNPVYTSLGTVPVSNKYYLTLCSYGNNSTSTSTSTSASTDPIKQFMNYISNESRDNPYPFSKSQSIDYAFLPEPDQFHHIDLTDNLGGISRQIDLFHSIVSESDGEIIVLIDIVFLINFLIKTQHNAMPNNFVDLLLFKMKGLEPVQILLYDDVMYTTINPNNVLYTQFSMCLKNYLHMDNSTIDANIFVPTFKIYRNINLPSEFSNYWKLLFVDNNNDVGLNPSVGTNAVSNTVSNTDTNTGADTDTDSDNEHSDNISIVTIGGEECYTTSISMGDILSSNLFDSQSSFPIEPLHRLNIVCAL